MSVSYVSVVCCQVDVSALADHSSRGILPSVVYLSDGEASIMRRPWPIRSFRTVRKEKKRKEKKRKEKKRKEKFYGNIYNVGIASNDKFLK